MTSGGEIKKMGHMIWGKIIEGDHIFTGNIKTTVHMIWGKSIAGDLIILGNKN
jgi:hypothetical protein